MTFNGYRDKALQDRQALEKLAEGKKQREVAAELGVTYFTLRRRLSRHVRAIGCRTLVQAVALTTAEKIKREMPLAVRGLVDRALKRPR